MKSTLVLIFLLGLFQAQANSLDGQTFQLSSLDLSLPLEITRDSSSIADGSFYSSEPQLIKELEATLPIEARIQIFKNANQDIALYREAIRILMKPRLDGLIKSRIYHRALRHDANEFWKGKGERKTFDITERQYNDMRRDLEDEILTPYRDGRTNFPEQIEKLGADLKAKGFPHYSGTSDRDLGEEYLKEQTEKLKNQLLQKEAVEHLNFRVIRSLGSRFNDHFLPGRYYESLEVKLGDIVRDKGVVKLDDFNKSLGQYPEAADLLLRTKPISIQDLKINELKELDPARLEAALLSLKRSSSQIFSGYHVDRIKYYLEQALRLAGENSKQELEIKRKEYNSDFQSTGDYSKLLVAKILEVARDVKGQTPSVSSFVEEIPAAIQPLQVLMDMKQVPGGGDKLLYQAWTEALFDSLPKNSFGKFAAWFFKFQVKKHLPVVPADQLVVEVKELMDHYDFFEQKGKEELFKDGRRRFHGQLRWHLSKITAYDTEGNFISERDVFDFIEGR